jgi:cytochrome c-type biogenesis protein CcmE
MRPRMDPARKRKIRLIVALTTAVLLAVALVYTSFSAATEAKQPSQLLSANPGNTYELTGKVVPGSIVHDPHGIRFRVSDRDGTTSIPVRYTGTVPDPFRDGREVVVTGRVKDGTFVGQRDSLVTKCPSKFSEGSNQ